LKKIILAILIILILQSNICPTQATENQTEADCEPCPPVNALSGTVNCTGASIFNPNPFQAHIVIKIGETVVIDGFALSNQSTPNQTTFFPWPEPYKDTTLTYNAILEWWAYCEYGTHDLGVFGDCEEPPPEPRPPSVGGEAYLIQIKTPMLGMQMIIIAVIIIALILGIFKHRDDISLFPNFL
jgi:hypothetical protein